MHASGDLPGKFAGTASSVGTCPKTLEKQHYSVEKGRGRCKGSPCKGGCRGEEHQAAIASNRVTIAAAIAATSVAHNDPTKMLAATNAADSDTTTRLAATRCTAAGNAAALSVCEFRA